MNPLLLIVASAAVGIDIGWQPLETGGLEYIIQFEPQQLDALTTGHDLVSDIPPELDVRRYRIQVGTGKLPHDLGPQGEKVIARQSQPAVADDATLPSRAGRTKLPAADEPVADEFEPTHRAAPLDRSNPLDRGAAASPLTNPNRIGMLDREDAASPPSNPKRASDVNAAVPAVDDEHEPAARQPVGDTFEPLSRKRALGSDDPAETTDPAARRGASDSTPLERSNLSEPAGPTAVRGPIGPFNAGSSAAPRSAASSSVDGSSPRSFEPDDEAGPLLRKPVEPAAFADQQRERELRSRDARDNDPRDSDLRGADTREQDPFDSQTHRAQKPSLADSTKSRSMAAADNEVAEEQKPWMTLVWTIAALCVSLGLNVYLGWIAWTARERYRLLLERTHGEPLEV